MIEVSQELESFQEVLKVSQPTHSSTKTFASTELYALRSFFFRDPFNHLDEDEANKHESGSLHEFITLNFSSFSLSQSMINCESQLNPPGKLMTTAMFQLCLNPLPRKALQVVSIIA